MKLRGILGESAAALAVANGAYIFTFLCNIALVRMLLPQDFGAVALALSLFGIIEVVTTFSLNTVLIQQREQLSLARAIFQVALAVIGLKLVIGAIFYLVVRDRYEDQIWQLFGLIFGSKLFAGVGTLLVARLEKRGEFLRATLVTVGANVAAVIAALIAVFFGLGVYGLVLREILPALLISIVMLLFYPALFPGKMDDINKRQLRVVVAVSFRLYFQRGAEISYMRIPSIMIENFFGGAALGLYSQATYLVTLVNRVTSTVNQQIATVFFSHNRRDEHETRQGYLALLGLNLVLALPVMALLWFYPSRIVLFLWNEEWLGAVPYLRLMAILTLLLPVFTLLKSRLLGLRRNTAITLVYLIGVVFLAGGLWSVRELPQSDSWVAGLTVAAYALMTLLCAFALSWHGRRRAAAPSDAQFTVRMAGQAD